MVAKVFRWNDWNLEHAMQHGCTVEEIERVVRHAGRGYPRKWTGRKWIVIGRGIGDRMVEVIYIVDLPPMIFVVHAMPLTTRRRR